MTQKNLKLILLDIHNQLIQNNNWIPGEGPPDQNEMIPAVTQAPTTQPLIDFVNFLNVNPQVRDLLQKHGVDWDTPNENKPSVISAIDEDDDPFAGEILTPSCRLDDPDCDSCQ